ncbi:Cysteine protease atg4 [Linderina macrospora]|uniref:Cysteine protease atg4 n=1 Tax=Linderina macrospora TaxID=4868 RepID=A0ACC1J1A7_9FUNG|nr:Cysteine protease atg4 [Linderina macrospora]
MHYKCPLVIHVALDQEVFTDRVRRTAFGGPKETSAGWKPLLLLVPVRLGLERLDPRYAEKVKTLFQIPQTVGLVGGKPARSYYFIGRQGDSLFFLDPHVTRNFVPRSTALDGQDTRVSATSDNEDGDDSGSESDSSDFESLGIADTDEYHTSHICTININKLDPSMLIGFLFNTEAEWEGFAQAATDKDSSRSICTGSTPLFTLWPEDRNMVNGTYTQAPIPGKITKVAAAVPERRGRSPPRSPRMDAVRFSTPRIPPTTTAVSMMAAQGTARSSSSPRFGESTSNDFANDDGFEIL